MTIELDTDLDLPADETRGLGPLGRVLAILVALNLALTALLLFLKWILPSFGDENSDAVGLASVMDGKALKSRARAFRGGSALTLAGASLIDLREAELEPEGARLQLSTVMGGTASSCPEGWNVKVQGAAMLGAVQVHLDDAAEEPPEDAPTLEVEAKAIMGSIEIVHKPRIVIEDAEYTETTLQQETWDEDTAN